MYKDKKYKFSIYNHIDPNSLSEEDKELRLKEFEEQWDLLTKDPLAQIIGKNGNKVGKIILFSSNPFSDSNNLEKLQEMFYEPKNYNLIKREPNTLGYFLPTWNVNIKGE